ncbi:hypothetical protein HYT84_01620 [Candidatus Micrarchaeota archaeon]|nr:hypothetical protein [Candidatus Micrarchaeota archaeon]
MLKLPDRPTSIQVGGFKGRIIYSKDSAGLFRQFDPLKERIVTINELMGVRVVVVENMKDEVFNKGFDKYTLTAAILKIFDEHTEICGVWKVRLTTSTMMVRALDSDNRDMVFFYSGNPFQNTDELAAALNGQLSDGGFELTNDALEAIRKKTPTRSKMTFEEYLKARGGNFESRDLLQHPIFRNAGGNVNLCRRYVDALDFLNLTDFYNAGYHSLWRPGEMKPGFGRLISLGYKGEAFYPPNNSTVDHAALVAEIKN